MTGDPTTAATAPRWTEAEDQALTRMWQAGVPVADVAATLGRTRKAVQIRAHRLEIARTYTPERARHRQDWTPIEDAYLEILVEDGRPQEEVANRLGRTPLAVHLRIRELRLDQATSTCPGCGASFDQRRGRGGHRVYCTEPCRRRTRRRRAKEASTP